MIDNDLRVKITDFGLARQQRGADPSKDAHLQNVVGTVLYTCPEILQNRPYTEKVFLKLKPKTRTRTRTLTLTRTRTLKPEP
jgi:hypothetical protein